MRHTNAEARPTALEVQVDEIPAALTGLAQWVCWSWIWNSKRSCWDKPPKQPNGRAASTTDPATWSSFEAVLKVYQAGGCDGIGFVLSEESGVVGIDLDDCRHEGELKPWAFEILKELKTYTEVSPSGSGVRAFVLGQLPGGGRKKGAIEVYAEGRYLTVTGNRIGRSQTLQERQEEVVRLWESLGAPAPAGVPATTSASGIALSDFEVIEKARSAKNGAAFWALYSGDAGAYASASEADLALVNRLVFWTNRDPARVDRLFRASGLMRSKWDERHGAETYGERTINRVLETTTEGYSGEPERPQLRVVQGSPAAGPAPAENGRIRIYTFDELLRRPAADVTWVAERFIARGGITELSAWIKAGKSTLTSQLVGAILQGRPFLNMFEVEQGPVMILTEEREGTFAQTLQEAGIEPGSAAASRLHIVPWNEQRGIAWPEIVKQAADAARELGCVALVIDTLGKWAGVEDENDAAGAERAMAPVTENAFDLAIMVLRQAGKSLRETQNAARGSSAYGGAADILLNLQHIRDDKGKLLEDDPRRRISVISRYERDQVKPMLVTYSDRRYSVIEATTVDESSSTKVLEDLRTYGPSRPLGIHQRTGLNRSTVRTALRRLCRRIEVFEADGIYRLPGQIVDTARYARSDSAQDVQQGATGHATGGATGNSISGNSASDDVQQGETAMQQKVQQENAGPVAPPVAPPRFDLDRPAGGFPLGKAPRPVTFEGETDQLRHSVGNGCQHGLNLAGLPSCLTHHRTLTANGRCPAVEPGPPPPWAAGRPALATTEEDD